MALLAEYALTHDVFDQSSYQSEELGDLHIQTLKEVLLNEGLVRDLRDGEWRSLFTVDSRPWHRRGRELLKKLVIQRRLISFPASLESRPTRDEDWCHEALASHEKRCLSGIIVTDCIADRFASDRLVACIDRLSSAQWWAGRSPSMRLRRTLEDYRSAVSLILLHANSIMFIDPHFDPSLHRYQDFIALLGQAGARKSKPVIELHRVCYRDKGVKREVLAEAEWQAIFRQEMTERVRTNQLNVEVFIWDDFHDRYIVTDLIGISTPNGFDTSKAVSNMTTWTRLGRADRDDVQREFDPASNRHRLRIRFKIVG